MSKNFIVTFAAGLALVAALIAGVFYSKRGAHLAPNGSVLKVRTQALDDTHTLAIMEVRLANDSDVTMTVRQINLTAETKEGHQLDGTLVSGEDVKQIFSFYPALGPQYNDPLLVRDRIPGHKTIDRMVAARFDAPEAEFAGRKGITIRVEDDSGTEAVLTGK